jgi:GYF domain 2
LGEPERATQTCLNLNCRLRQRNPAALDAKVARRSSALRLTGPIDSASKADAMSEAWYYVNSGQRSGPLSLHGMRETLATLPDAKNVLVWCEGFPDWKIAGDVNELRARSLAPPPLPSRHLPEPMPTWRVRWWWYPVAVCFFGSIGNRDGRRAMAWLAVERQTARKIKRSASF